MAHAPNDALTVEWARTLRIDAPASKTVQTRVAAVLVHDGVRISFGPPNTLARTYILLEGPQGIDPAELQSRVPEAHWYDEAIIALAIEPAPEDALPQLADALGGPGAPAGVCGVDRIGNQLVVEFRPSVTQATLVLGIADVELRRFSGYRRTRLLSALPVEVAARVAADGLQAPEIASDRILESLLGAPGVE